MRINRTILTGTHLLLFKIFSLSPEEGVLHCDIIEGSFDTASFCGFVEHTLDHMQPFLASNSVIVMDNCRIHKHIDIQNLIESW